MRRSRITLSKIAQAAGVSVATVSRVMNNDANVTPAIGEKVREIARKLDYGKPRRRVKKTGVVGLIVPNVLNPFFPLLIKGLESVAKIQAYNVILCDSEDSIEVENENIEKLIDFKVDGLIYVSSEGRNEKIVELIEDRFPIVVLDRKIHSDQACCVMADNLEGAYQAVKYLISIGHRRILHLAGSLNLNTGRDRLEGYRKALVEEGIPFEEDLVLNGDFHFSKAYEEIKASARSRRPFTAIFSSNDAMAFGAFQALREMEITVPGDVSIVGYDDVRFASVLGLTTVSQPIYEMGRNSMIMLVDLISERISPPRRVLLRPSMVIRSTCQRILKN